MARKLANTEERFGEYLARLGEVIGHADRREPLRAYMAGLLLPGERKSVEPMAAKVDPRNVESRHQSMHHFVADAPWDAREVIRVARDWALEQFDRHAPIQAWVIDDTGIPKKGKHSVGVARQYCGVLGKQDNCQVAVSITLTNDVLSVPAAYRLYLPESWAKDKARRRVARVPEEIEFRTKWQIALDQIDALLADGIPRAPVVMDAGYGTTTELRDELVARDLIYVAGVQGEVTVWPEDEQPLAPKPYGGRGRPPTLLRRSEDAKPVSVAALALQLPKTAWRSIRWRGGTKGDMRSRFARIRVRAAHRDNWRREPRPEEWLLIEWPTGETKPTKFWLSNVAAHATMTDLVHLAKARWRIERDYQELKDEIGIDHYEGRGWVGFHHHGALCIAAYAFLVAERARLSPPAPLAFLEAPPVPRGFRPRGSPAKT
jgi:SRSO17 transposase